MTAQTLLKKLLATSVVLQEDLEALPSQARATIANCQEPSELLDHLVEQQLITEYQASRISVGKRIGLVLGNYRVLERLGVGGMGVVYKAQHIHLRQMVAIKVFTLHEEQDSYPYLLQRFFAEMRVIAMLRHPNIVHAFDAGEVQNRRSDSYAQHYFVMEYVEGEDLESYIQNHGPLPPALACEVIYQVASALDEAHKHRLIHRDIKPANILLTKDFQSKLLDFGLAQGLMPRMTEPGTVLGTVDYIAPEQARDSSAVDIRADIYGLGGTLFWAIAGQTPFAAKPSITQDLTARLTQQPPSVRGVRSSIAPELDAIITRMMALNADDRYPTPQAVMRALLPFTDSGAPRSIARPAPATSGPTESSREGAVSDCRSIVQRTLIVDDEGGIREMCRMILESENIVCAEAANGTQALETLTERAFDLVLLDVDMPGMSGLEVAQQLREKPPRPNLKIIFVSGRLPADELARTLLSGADDFITKPFDPTELVARARSNLRLKAAQDRTMLLTQNILRANRELEKSLTARDSDLVEIRNTLVLSLAKLVEKRQGQAKGHLQRMQRYCKCLAEEAARLPSYGEIIDDDFVQMLEITAPLYDIGKVALPDEILLKPGKLTAEERFIMESHTSIGAETLMEIAKDHGPAIAFLGMAIDIARHHHERFDGKGYPDGLSGANIPLSARLVAFADVYDSLRSRRSYKPALSHNAAREIITKASEGQFDPELIPAFERVAPPFEAIFRDMPD